jgi:SDR family mycofactocin-dependent oxidoreductase
MKEHSMNRLQGKVAFITGAARGQGRSHALRLAEEGAAILAVDVCNDLASVPYDLATEEDLAHTEKLVTDRGGQILTRIADVRDQGQLNAAVSAAVDTFGRIDVVVANAGVTSFGAVWELTEQAWQDVVDINLTGVWKTTKAAIPKLIDQGTGGSIILTSSLAGLVAFGNLAHYTATKHAITGLMRALALELAPHGIRVNSVHPTTVDTPMVNNTATYALFAGGRDGASRDDALAAMTAMNGFPVPWVEPVDVSNAVVYLASDDARYVSGTTHVIDANALAPFKFSHS